MPAAFVLHMTDSMNLEKDLLLPEEGAGRLLQRDYWAVINGCTTGPREIAELVREKFVDFPPSELVEFRRVRAGGGRLEVGDELDVHIRMAGTFRVRVLHCDANSVTLGTIKGHPEAGRITFGSYRNARGDVVFHIRSVARAGSKKHLLGFMALGEAMQTNCWTDFVNKVAAVAGAGVIGAIQAETCECDDDLSDDVAAPTFLADGD